MGSSWPALGLVLGWIPMLIGVRPPKLRPVVTRPVRAEPGREPRGAPVPEGREREAPAFDLDRPRSRPDVSRLDGMLLLLTWFGCVALTAMALWDSHRHPDLIRLTAGVLVFWIGIALWLWGRGALGEHFTQRTRAPATLVTRGPFRLVRHPLYLATTIACLGQALAGGSVSTFALWAFIASVLSVRARREERLLRDGFGPTWNDYARRTPRILP